MPIGRSIIKYGFTSRDYGFEPIFVVEHLTQRAFDAGFRTLNPEFPVSSYELHRNEELLTHVLDEIEGLDNKPHTDAMSPLPQDPITYQLPPSRVRREPLPGKSAKEWSIIASAEGKDR